MKEGYRTMQGSARVRTNESQKLEVMSDSRQKSATRKEAKRTSALRCKGILVVHHGCRQSIKARTRTYTRANWRKKRASRAYAREGTSSLSRLTNRPPDRCASQKELGERKECL